MELYRKYYNDDLLRVLREGQPDWGVTVRTVGHNIHKPKLIYPDPAHPDAYHFDWNTGRVLDEFQLVYIPNGHGTFEAEGVRETSIEAGTVFLLFPGVWHRYHPSSETGWEEFWVGYQGHYAEYLMQQKCFKKDAPFVHIGFNAELLNVFIQLIDAVKHEDATHHKLSACLITQLLALVYSSAIMTDVPRQTRYELVHIARYRMHEQLDTKLDMAELAGELNMSYTRFRKVFKEAMGVAPGQYYLNLKIEKACKLLRATGSTVAEISCQLGFESEFYFSRIFKKKVGMSPGQFRVNQ